MEKKEVRQARESLRGLYGEYTKELYSIANKIDKHLEVIENEILDG
jgi:hypothetical protein